MALRTITVANTVDQWKTNYNSLATDVGDLSLLGTTHDSNLVLAINELIGEFDSTATQRLARKAISAGTGIIYDSATGIISLTIPNNTITNAMMADSAVGTAELQNNAVTTIKIIDNAITFAKMADSSVGTSELRNSAVTYQKMQNIATANRVLGSTTAGGAVSEVQIATGMIATGAVDSAALGALSVSSAKLQASIPDSKLATISTASKVSNSATTATSANTASAIVARDASGNFTAGTITAALTTLSIGGTAVTSTAAELNYNDITTLGTSQASKTVTADANGDVKFSNAVVETVFALTGTTPALNPTSGMIQTWTLSASSTPTDSLNDGESLTLMVDDGTAYAITWPSVTWKTDGGVAPTLNTTGYTVIVLWKVSTVLYGARVGNA